MRILLVSPHFMPHIGGVETHVSHLASGLVARGHDVTVLTHSRVGTGTALADSYEVLRVPSWSPAVGLPASPTFGLTARRHAHDIVHVHNLHSWPFVQAPQPPHGALVATTHYHGAPHTLPARVLAPLHTRLAGRVLNRCSAVIAVSPSEELLLSAHYPALRERLTVIPNGIVTRGRSPVSASRPTTGPLSDLPQRFVLSVGRLDAHKRVDRLVDAIAASDDLTAVIAGDGPQREELMSRAAPLGSRVRFLGQVSEVELEELYALASAFASLSAHESFGLSLSEALVAGLPTVASDIAAHHDLVAMLDRTDVRIVGTDASPHLVAAQLRDAVRAARTPTVNRWPWSTVTERTESLYLDVLRTGTSARH